MSIFAVLAEPLSCISLTIETLSVSNLCYLIGSLGEASKTKIVLTSLNRIGCAPFVKPVFFGPYNMISVWIQKPNPDFSGKESQAIGGRAPALLTPFLTACQAPHSHRDSHSSKLNFSIPVEHHPSFKCIMVCNFFSHLKFQLQEHLCPLDAEHIVGFDCLSDEQALHILMFMDADTVINFSRYLGFLPLKTKMHIIIDNHW